MLMVEHVMADRQYVRKMHRRGYRIFVWTVNEPEDMRRVIDNGVDGIITDYPARLLDILQNP